MRGGAGLEVPGQQVGDAVEHVTEVGFGVEAVELGDGDQGCDCRGAVAALIPVLGEWPAPVEWVAIALISAGVYVIRGWPLPTVARAAKNEGPAGP